ncbi:MAG: hypothetical protein IJH17_03220, partial [Clostridia bacterium]|nr:hypothetical protein [Clostridia bacterium]
PAYSLPCGEKITSPVWETIICATTSSCLFLNVIPPSAPELVVALTTSVLPIYASVLVSILPAITTSPSSLI